MRGVPAPVDRHAGTREAYRTACPRPEGRRLQVVCAFEHVARVHRLPAPFSVYRLFDGEVVSCEEGTVKPEPRIYEILLERYGLDPAETLFIDDRAANIAAAEGLGIAGYLSTTGIPPPHATSCAAGCCNNRKR
ncbi:MAG: HAD-IA family hydrolase [Alistipes finegoldii]